MPRSQNFVELLAQFGGKPRILAAGGNGHLHASTLHPGGHDEAALRGGIGDVGKDAFGSGGDADAMVGEAIIGGGVDQHVIAQVGGAETAGHQAHGHGLELRFPLGSDDGYARARFQKTSGLAERDLARANHQHRAILQIQEYGVVFQVKSSPTVVVFVGQIVNLRRIGNPPAADA
jgi:hypothetical protein